MRLPIAVLVASLALPASAPAGVVGLEGTQLVFRADAGERVRLISGFDAREMYFFHGQGVRPGPACVAVKDGAQCPPAGVTGVAILTGDADDTVAYWGGGPVSMALGAGNDSFHGQAEAVTADGGPGDDLGLVEGMQLSAVGGEGDDELRLHTSDGSRGPLALDGGAGDDVLVVRHQGLRTTFPRSESPERAPRAGSVAIACGAGADRWMAGPRDVPGGGCAPHVTGITPDTVSRVFREGTLTGRARGSVTLRRRAFQSEDPRERVASGGFSRPAGPLRVRLGRAKSGPVAVTIRIRRGAEQGDVAFLSRLR